MIERLKLFYVFNESSIDSEYVVVIAKNENKAEQLANSIYAGKYDYPHSYEKLHATLIAYADEEYVDTEITR